MRITPIRAVFKPLLALLACLALTFNTAPGAEAHVQWTQTNQPDPEMLVLYHFDEHVSTTGQTLAAADPLPENRRLTLEAPAGLSARTVHDTAGEIFNPHALEFRGAQRLRSEATLGDISGDVTIEFWMRWDSAVTSQTLQAGLASGAKLYIARDTLVPANDRFGILGTHGSYVSAPGFVSWAAVGEDEAPFDEWLHFAVTIHSTGLYYNSGTGHDMYNPGSIARLWLNGHAVGAAPHTVNIESLQVHDASRIVLQSVNGGVKVDEFAVWKKDWSKNGTASNPFADGRGLGLINRLGWTQVNQPDPEMIALYHLDDEVTTTGDRLSITSPLHQWLRLTLEAPAGAGAISVHDTPDTIFDPHALELRSAQRARSELTVGEVDGDLTIEFWLRWDSSVTSQTFQAGLASGAKLLIARDTAVPANDRFGIMGTHGSYVSAPGFVSWDAVGEEEAPLNEWLHFAVTIHSTGLYYNSGTGHDMYNPGSEARLWLNGLAFGSAPQTVNIESLQVHDATRIVLQSVNGGVRVDEFAVWRKDWSQNGTIATPFSNGRGAGLVNAARDWVSYE